VEFDGVIVVRDLDLSGLDLLTENVERIEEKIEYVGPAEVRRW